MATVYMLWHISAGSKEELLDVSLTRLPLEDAIDQLTALKVTELKITKIEVSSGGPLNG